MIPPMTLIGIVCLLGALLGAFSMPLIRILAARELKKGLKR